jgi:hypothetical protein
MSQILPKVFAAFREEGTTLRDVAEAIQIEPEEVDKLVFGLMLVSLQGRASAGTGSPRRASFQLVD